MFDALYGLAHAALIVGIVAVVCGLLWFAGVLWINHQRRTAQGPGRRARRLRWRFPIVLIVVAGLLMGLASYVGSARVTVTTVGALVNNGRTTDQAGLRTEAEVYATTVSTTVYYKPLVGGTATSDKINNIFKYLDGETTTVHVQVGVYGLVNFAEVQGARAVINLSARSITVDLPRPTEVTYIYSVDGVQVAQGPARALVTALKAVFGSFLGKPLVSTDISGQLAAAERSEARTANQSEIYGCGTLELEEQLAGMLAVLPQYQGWGVAVDYPGMQPETASVCQQLQLRLAPSG